jgi:hypothetical protein
MALPLIFERVKFERVNYLKRHQILHPFRRYSPEWHDFRMKGLGGSDVGAVMKLNPYDSVWDKWQEKVGLKTATKKLNENMLYGILFEDLVANMWSLYDDTIDSDKVPGYVNRFASFDNQRALDTSVRLSQFQSRKSMKVHGIIQNEKFPWLFISLDRIIPPGDGQYKLLPGRPILKQFAPLECKTMNQWVAGQFKDDVPPYYKSQSHTYLLVLEVDYCEFSVLIAGQRLKVMYFEQDEDFSERMLDETHVFWHQHVLPARLAYQRVRDLEARGDYRGAEMAMMEVTSFEPHGDGTQQYIDYLSERAKREMHEEAAVTLDKTNVNFTLGVEYKMLGALAKALDEKYTERKARLIQFMREFRISKIDFGKKYGHITWYPNKGSEDRRFYNGLKVDVDQGWVDGEIAKINIDIETTTLKNL